MLKKSKNMSRIFTIIILSILSGIIPVYSSANDISPSSFGRVTNATANDLTITSTRAVSMPYAGIGPQWGGYDEIKSWTGSATLSDSDWKKLFDRVAFMRPGLIRIMGSQGWNYMNNGVYNPEKSKDIIFKILDFCEVNKIDVMFGEWGETALSNNAVDTVWLNRAVSFLDYLINTKKYSCLKYYNMCNEPAGSWSSIGGDYDLWTKTYVEILKRLKQKQLDSKITVIAPDVSVGMNMNLSSWISNTNNNFGDQIGAYDIHVYPDDEKVKDGTFLSVIGGYRNLAPMNKDFIIGEIGYKYNPNSTLGNENSARIARDPYASDDSNMMVYDAFYGIDMANVIIQSMKAGCNGIIIWDMDDAMYQKGYMRLKRWGFWNILGEEKFESAADENIRPWFYPMSLMCRYFPVGSLIYKVNLPDKKGIEAIAAEKDGKYSILVVNHHNVDYSINLKMENGVLISKALFFNYIASESGNKFEGTVDVNGFPTAFKTEHVDLTQQKYFPLEVKARSFTLISNMTVPNITDTVADSKIVADFDETTSTFQSWGNITNTINIPPGDNNGNALQLNIPANNSNGDGCWLNCPFTKSQYSDLNFKIKSEVNGFEFMVKLESSSEVTLDDKWFTYTEYPNWQNFAINLTDVGNTEKFVIFPAAWRTFPSFTMYMDDLVLKKTISAVHQSQETTIIKIYSDRNTGILNIQTEDFTFPGIIQLFSSEGKLFYHQQLLHQTEIIDMKKFNFKGLLFVNVMNAIQHHCYKLII